MRTKQHVIALLIVAQIGNSLTTGSAKPRPSVQRFAEEILGNYGKWARLGYKHELDGLRAFRDGNRSNLNREDDKLCMNMLNYALEHPVEKSWTTKLLESRGRFGGLFSGTSTSLGDFDSCLAIDERDRKFAKPIKGKYCFVTQRLPTSQESGEELDYLDRNFFYQPGRNWTQFASGRWLASNERYPLAQAICIPSLCRAGLIRELVESSALFNSTSDSTKKRHSHNSAPNGTQMTIGIEYCQVSHGLADEAVGEREGIDQQEYMRSSYLFALIVFLIAISAAVLGTAAHSYYASWEKPPESTFGRRLLDCFALQNNFRSLFSVSEETNYPWINGMRVLFTLLVLISHTSVQLGVLQLSALSPHSHFPDDIKRQSESFINLPIVNSNFELKFFFTVSGFLLTANFLQKSQLHSFGRYVLNRWARFTPTVVGFLAFSIILSLLGSGPLFHQRLIEPYVKPCFGNILRQITFTNNLGYFQQACGFHMWYISADLQLYVLSYPILWLLSKNKFSFAYSVIFFMIVLAYANSYINFFFLSNGFPLFTNAFYPQIPVSTEYFLTWWTRPLNHAEAYFFGAFVGVLVGKSSNDGLSKKTINLIWTLTLTAMCILPFTFPWFYRDRESRSLWTLYENTSIVDGLVLCSAHALWIMAFGWIFYSGAKHYGKGKQFSQLNGTLSFFSAAFSRPFGRLSFCVYLAHVPLTWFAIHTNRHSQSLNELAVPQFIMLIYLQSLFAAIALYVLFESPFNKLVSLLFEQFDKCFATKKDTKTITHDQQEDAQRDVAKTVQD